MPEWFMSLVCSTFLMGVSLLCGDPERRTQQIVDVDDDEDSEPADALIAEDPLEGSDSDGMYDDLPLGIEVHEEYLTKKD